jgi:hypothetical protein
VSEAILKESGRPATGTPTSLERADGGPTASWRAVPHRASHSPRHRARSRPFGGGTPAREVDASDSGRAGAATVTSTPASPASPGGR